MAVVYEVRREEGGFRQTAALKLLRRGAWDGEAVRRFAQERQILALLAHPAIASLLDGGVAPDGRPYLVVELVRGLPITLHAARRDLDLRARLRLVAVVARAVGAAHRRLVVHRDIKPSNILVDDSGAPKLLDFGIARVLADDFPGESPRTRPAQRLLTPEYASPEQVLGRPVTVASDIYQLGLLLFEMLTGQRAQPLDSGAIGDIAQTVCFREPPRPSQVVPRASLPRARDLDAIVGRALRKEPEQRYTSCDALADDIEAYLEGRPVEARRGSRAYRASRFALRHRFALSLVSLAVAGLAFHSVSVSMQSRRIRDERDRAAAEARRADELKDFVLASFLGADPNVARGRNLTLRDHLANATGQARVDLADRPALRGEILATIGRVHIAQAEYDLAASVLSEALADFRRAEPPDPVALAETLRHFGRALHYSGRYFEAEAPFREALRLREALGPSNGLQSTVLRRHIGCLLHALGRYDEAEALLRRGLAETEGAAARAAGGAATAWARIDLADLLLDAGATPEAQALYRTALAESTDPRWADELAGHWARDGLGRVLLRQGELNAASALILPTLEARRVLYAPRHALLAESLRSAGLLRLAEGRLEQAASLLEEAAAQYRAVLSERHAFTARAELDLARLELARGRVRAAARHGREALGRLERIGFADHPWYAEARRVAARAGLGTDRVARALAPRPDPPGGPAAEGHLSLAFPRPSP
ncbi:MAG: serine/threonine-protein kinase [Acidobacteria bacterium]|nr:serine/threonine-protein kinase [Acidobacteriota bacterium]